LKNEKNKRLLRYPTFASLRLKNLPLKKNTKGCYIFDFVKNLRIHFFAPYAFGEKTEGYQKKLRFFWKNRLALLALRASQSKKMSSLFQKEEVDIFYKVKYVT
jgi:hypothetical protein